ncbi:protein kinase domain containing protein [Stylonychia lemnae]|uniref:Casein kinase I n=1 Tax=Stylonychia lemnae TaxID=5949 RepID=A0A077ZMV0_STYLE|nr:protein kinase domain containing protein [Stylonychia lemnae]|eukprot:CDW71292.1 protein kinase domain containing protein [Stylonychia lemnae]
MVESKNCIDNQAPEVFQGYKRISVLGSGTFGIVFKYQKNDQIISIKFSKPNSYSNDCLNEAIIMRKMTEDGRHGFFPKYIKNGCTKVNDKIVNYLMMEYLDEQINAINDSQNSNQFDFQDGLDQIGQKLFVSMITVVQQLHNSGYIHRDIKPSNFMMKDGKVYIIDFGLSKQYLKDGVHCDQLEQIQQLKGSPFFASLNSHNLIDISRRDDLESLAYTFLYIINLLPWIIYSLEFNQEPPYENLRQIFLNSHDQISNNKDEQMALLEVTNDSQISLFQDQTTDSSESCLNERKSFNQKFQQNENDQAKDLQSMMTPFIQESCLLDQSNNSTEISQLQLPNFDESNNNEFSIQENNQNEYLVIRQLNQQIDNIEILIVSDDYNQMTEEEFELTRVELFNKLELIKSQSNQMYQELKQIVSLFKKNPSDEFIQLDEYQSEKTLKIIDDIYSIINFHKDIDITVRLSLDSIYKDYKNIEITKESTVQFMSEIYGWNNGQDMILNEEERSYEFQISRQIWQDLANKQLNKRKR